MRKNYLKNALPRSLYGRSALILILPVLTLQLVVSVVFIQRHFEGVTAQLTRNVLAEVGFILEQIDEAPDLSTAQELAQELGPELELVVYLPRPLQPGDERVFYDFTGLVVLAMLYDRLPGLVGADLRSNLREVQLSIASRHGGIDMRLPRGRVSASNPHQLLVWTIFTGLLMTAISIIFLRNQLRPIRRLARAAEAFGKGRIVPYSPLGATEVRAAGAAFLDMRARIERHIEQRTLMLSGISHDLRTPLTRLRLGLALLEPSEEVDAMLRDVEDMERLVDEFLSFARGDALDAAELVDLTGLVRRVIEDAKRSGQPVQAGELDETGLVGLRPLAVTRAAENLLGNAIRYGRRARVALASLPGAVRLRIEDDGPGIPEEMIAQALKPFSRLDPARNQDRAAGVGLGLAIAADIARRHGGRLELGRSEDLGGLRADLVLAR